MKLKEFRLDVTTDESGDGTATGPAVFGLLFAVDWIDGTFADGVDGTFTYTTPDGVSKTLLTLTDANSDATYYPRVGLHSNTGAALTYDGTRPVTGCDLIAGKVLLTVAEGGATKTGGAVVYYIESDD